MTFPMKYLFTIVWIGGFGLGTLFVWLHAPTAQDGDAMPPDMRWLFLGMWIVGSALLLWSLAGLKRVRMDATQLYISNYRREIVVPFANVVDVTENRWVNIHPVTLHFRSPTAFGQRVTFMPTALIFGMFRSHPVVAQLRERAGLR